jgi:1,4-dihydroxy-2-naphthoate octaprenyltransferase
VVPVLVGAGAARPVPTLWGRLALCVIVALSLQVGTNYVNDYADGIRGTDEQRVGPLRLTASKLASPQAVRTAAVVAFGIAAAAGFWLAALTSWWLIAIGAAAVLAGWTYTGGPRPYGYAGMGELFVFVFFGLVATAGTSYCLAGRVTWLAILAGCSMGLFSCAVLGANNLRDIAGDVEAGKRTLAVRLGRRAAGWLYVLCIAGGFACALGCAPARAGALLVVVAIPFAAPPVRAVLGVAEGRALLPVLIATVRVLLMVGVAFTVGLWWSA